MSGPHTIVSGDHEIQELYGIVCAHSLHNFILQYAHRSLHKVVCVVAAYGQLLPVAHCPLCSSFEYLYNVHVRITVYVFLRILSLMLAFEEAPLAILSRYNMKARPINSFFCGSKLLLPSRYQVAKLILSE